MDGRKKIIDLDQFLVLVLVFFAIVVTNVPRLSELLVYDRRAILNGELWRLLTAPLVHFSASHLFWDAAVFAAAGMAANASGFRGLWPVCGFGAVVPGLIYLLWSPGLERYGGLSGLAAGAVAYFCLCSVRQYGRRWTIWLLILLGTGLKIIIETAMCTPVFARVESISYRVLPSAHLIGFLGAVATIILYRRKNSWTNSEKSLTFPLSNSIYQQEKSPCKTPRNA
jgi:rhomboid family GlyGly-CTERM serine protease